VIAVPAGSTTVQRVLTGLSSDSGSERRLNPENTEAVTVLYGQGEWGTLFDADIDREVEASSGSLDEEDGVA
jgi:type VI secretion system secreted protein VgrG